MMGRLLKQSPDVSWGGELQTPHSGIHIYKEKDGISVSGWYDSIVGIQNLFISWEELQSWIPRAKRTKKVSRHVRGK